MPFSLRSDEELIAEARRALEALGVAVVLDDTSSSVEACARRHKLARGSRVAVLTSRAAIGRGRTHSESCGLVLASGARGERWDQLLVLHRQQHLDAASGAALWWRRTCADSQWRSAHLDCCVCRQRVPIATHTWPPCQQCFASICTPCIERAKHFFRCPECDAWYLLATQLAWGVPWDMPRPAPTRREASTTAAAPPARPSALPPRMAAAVGPDGWLRLPPRHQRMHPVDVLVDGVLAALDGQVSVYVVKGTAQPAPGNEAHFTRRPFSDSFGEKSATLGDVRRDLRRAVDGLMCEACAGSFPEVKLEVRRTVAQVHALADKPVTEVSKFVVRQRQRGGSAGGAEEHAWELVQAAPEAWVSQGDLGACTQRTKVAYLEPLRVTRSLVLRQVLRDAHVRLGGAACGAKDVLVLRSGVGGARAPFFRIELDGAGRVLGPLVLPTWESITGSWLHHARAAGQGVSVVCRNVEALQRAGLQPEGRGAVLLDLCAWRLEGLAWRQRQQRRVEVDGDAVTRWRALRWERRGGAGRRGRRRREPGVVFGLGTWGEERRALSHEEAAWALEEEARL